MIWANSVLPVYIGTSGNLSSKRIAHLSICIQVDTTKNVVKTLICHIVLGIHRIFNRTVVTQSQTVYVSAYPHVFMGPRGTVFDLSITLLIRNIDPKLPITITSVDYYDTNGKLTKKYLISPMKVNPMASKEIHITEKDTGGGMGSNFIVHWKAEEKVNTPIIEAVMIGGKSGQGISFISRGKEITE